MRSFSLAAAVALAAVLLLAAADAAPAQGVSTTGKIRGRVVDDEGQPLSGAQVVATNTETNLRRGVITTGSGLYVIPLLPPGPYTVRVDLIGYRSAELQDVRVTIGQATAANFELATAAVEVEGIEVNVDRPEVDVADAGVTSVVTREDFESLPSINRNFTEFIRLSGLVAPDPAETTGGQFSIAGMRPSQTNLQIDGVDANNSFFGENRGGSRAPFTFSLEAIREFQVITNGFDVEYGRYNGGIVNAVTRGGTNDFEGSVYGNYRSDAFTSQGFDGDDPADFEETQFAGFLSGPIVRDEAFFFASLDGQIRREPQIPITRQRFSPDGSDPNPALFDQVGRFFDALSNEYGISNPEAGYRSFQTEVDELTFFGRVDWNIDPDHRLSVRHNYADFQNDKEWNPFFDFEFGRSRAEDFQSVSHSFVTELQSVLGPRTFNVFRFQFADEDRPRNGRDLRPAVVVNLEGGQEIGYGGTFAAFQNDLDERKIQLIDNFTHSFGDHTVKVGGQALFTNIKNQFILEGAGEYRFASLEDFRNFRPSAFERNIRPGGEVPFSDFDVFEWALYAQDEWQVTPKLLATVGLRYDQQRFQDAPGRVVSVERAFGFPTGRAPVDNDNVSPRLALSYDVRGNGRSVVRGGVGYFYGNVPFVLGGNVQQTEEPTLSLRCTGDIEEGDPNAPPSPENYGQWSPSGDDNPFSCAGEAGAAAVPEFTLWNTDFEFPETFKANVGYEQMIGLDTRVKADLLYSRSTNLYTVRNLNLRDAQFTLENEGGRRVFQPEDGFDPAASNPTANAQRARRNLEFDDVFVNFNDGRAESFAATFEVAHNFSPDARVRLNYTFNRSYDNSSYSCCTAGGGFENPRVGVFGPNDIGSFGDTDKAWGPSDFVRDHTVVLNGQTRLPYGFRVSAFWHFQTGRPWTPEISGDLNGDGVRFNDRPFVFAPENLPLATDDPEEARAQRDLYRQHLANNSCVADDVGGVVERGACRFPAFNRLDIQIAKTIETFRGQRAEIELDLFNVLNGINSDWGRFVGVFASNRNLLVPERYDRDAGEILYSVPENFGEEGRIGSNLLFQFQAKLGVRYVF